MKREKFYDVMVTVFSSSIVGFFIWFLTIEKKLPVIEKDVEKNTEDIRIIKGDLKEQNKEIIQMLHDIQLELKDKKDRE